MSEPKSVPEVVLFRLYGRTQVALVLSARDGEVSHLGQNGEPLLTLAVVKRPGPNAPHKRPTPLQDAVKEPEIEIHRDVVHASHEFSKEFKKEKRVTTPAQIATLRGQGEWSEYLPTPSSEPAPEPAPEDQDKPDDSPAA